MTMRELCKDLDDPRWVLARLQKHGGDMGLREFLQAYPPAELWSSRVGCENLDDFVNAISTYSRDEQVLDWLDEFLEVSCYDEELVDNDGWIDKLQDIVNGRGGELN